MQVALPARTDPRPRTFAPAADAVQRTADGVTLACVPGTMTANETFTRAPARGLAGERAKPVTTGLAARTVTLTETLLFAELGSGTARSVARATTV
jgi:hypothetical protein